MTPPDAERLRVVQLNAGSLVEPAWETRRHEVVAWLDRLDPDVVCLQEVWADDANAPTAAWIADRLPHHGWHLAFGGGPFAPALWPDEAMRFGSAVLSRWPIDDSTYHALPVAEDPPPFTAGIPWELLHVRTAGLDVFSTHLVAPPDEGRHRRRQVVAIDEIVRAVRGDRDTVRPGVPRSGMPAILCGDLNAEPDSDEVRFLCGFTELDGRSTYWQDAWRVAGEGDGATQDPRTHPLAAMLNVPRKRIDYVFVGDAFLREDGAGRVLGAARAFDEPLTGVMASDHAGLVVDVAWPERPR